MNDIKTITEFPRKTREIADMRIPMPDGSYLSARVWMPVDAETNPVPAILEHLPYRKRDGTAVRDALTHPYFAGHGYACIRVDMRGNGDSEGLMADEYTEQELSDACEVIAWLAAQPWCSGKVGMMARTGTSSVEPSSSSFRAVSARRLARLAARSRVRLPRAGREPAPTTSSSSPLSPTAGRDCSRQWPRATAGSGASALPTTRWAGR